MLSLLLFLIGLAALLFAGPGPLSLGIIFVTVVLNVLWTFFDHLDQMNPNGPPLLAPWCRGICTVANILLMLLCITWWIHAPDRKGLGGWWKEWWAGVHFWHISKPSLRTVLIALTSLLVFILVGLIVKRKRDEKMEFEWMARSAYRNFGK